MLKRTLHFFILLFFCLLAKKSTAQYIDITDQGFSGYLYSTCPSCMLGFTNKLDTTCAALKDIRIANLYNRNIYDLNGLQYFSGLNELDCSNNQLTSLPVLPSGLTKLDCSNNKIIQLPALPSSISTLNCATNKLTSLPELPFVLQSLYCASNLITELPALPDYLKILNTEYCPLTALPTLPSTLIELECFQNKLISLPVLPRNLGTIGVSYNQLTSLPELPANIVILYCDHNQLYSLPSFEGKYYFNELVCSYNHISVIPDLPIDFFRFECANNNLKCLPVLPSNLVHFSAKGNSLTCLPNLPLTNNFVSDIGYTICSDPNANGCLPAPPISGYVYIDDNLNGLKDINEQGYANAKLLAGDYIFTTDHEGYYKINADIGSYELKVYRDIYPRFNILPISRNITISSYGQISTGNDFAMQPVSPVNDLTVVLTSVSGARRGRGASYTITYSNTGTTDRTGIVQLNYDALLQYDSSSVATNNLGLQSLSWNINDLKPGQTETIKIYFSVPVQAAIGTPLTLIAQVNPINDDAVPSDNKDTLRQNVTNSFDPNFKEVIPNHDITPEQAQAQEEFTYTVHFQNTGSDTAFVVKIQDTLSTNFEIKEIETLSSSHPATLKMKNNAATWTFNNILLPDSTTNERASHGFIKYRIVPKNDLIVGDEIKNNAHIYFDYNEPVQTNTVVNKVKSIVTAIVTDASSEQLFIYPNPSNGLVTFFCNNNGIGSVKVLNVEGELIKTILNQDLSQEIKIDLSSESKGLYFIQAVTDTRVLTKKLILN